MIDVRQLDKILHAAEKSELENSFAYFAKKCLVGGLGETIMWNWHLELLCDAMQKFYNREIDDCGIAVPPRTLKSVLTSQIFPAWCWVKNPKLQFLTACHTKALALRDARKTRDIIGSLWFQTYWPDIKVRFDARSAGEYYLTHGGMRKSLGVDSDVTGFGGDFIIIDDPISMNKIGSKLERAKVLTWYNTAMGSRGNTAGLGKLLIAQRAYPGDLHDYVMQHESTWTHIVLPMEYNPKKVHTNTIYGKYDVRTEAGELLHPARTNRVAVEKLKRTLGKYNTAAQLNQDPKYVGGAVFQINNFNVDPLVGKQIILKIITVDCAEALKTSSDFTAFGCFGLTKDNRVVVCDVMQGRWEHMNEMPHQLTQFVQRQLKDPIHVGGVEKIYIEKKSTGISLIPLMRSSEFIQNSSIAVGQTKKPYRVSDKGGGGELDKYSKAVDTSRVIDAGLIYFTSMGYDWVEPFLQQLESFTAENNAGHDDMMDVFMDAIFTFKPFLNVEEMINKIMDGE